MAIKVEHEIHHRRFGRNLGVGVLLGSFVALVFGLTVVKVTNIEPAHSGQHQPATQTEGTVKP